MPSTLKDLVTDPDFARLPPERQRALAIEKEADLAQLPVERQDRFLSDLHSQGDPARALRERGLQAGHMAPFAEVRKSLQGTPGPFRPAVEAAGAAGGMLLGGPAGALTGYGLAALPFEVAGGEVDPTRLGVQALGTAALQATPLGRDVSIGKRVLGSGLVTAMAGQAYDLMHDWWSGKPRDTKAQVGTMTRDLIGGALGQTIAENQATGAAAKTARRQEALSATAEQRARFARAGVTPKASELVSPGRAGVVRGLEDIPRGTLTGAPEAFAERRAGEAGRAVERAVAGVSPTTQVGSAEEGGYILRDAIEAGHGAAEKAWGQAFDATEAVTGNEPVVPTTQLRTKARSVLRTAQRTPYGAPPGTGKLARTPETVYAFTGETERGARPGTPPTPAPAPPPAGPAGGPAIGQTEQPGIYPPGIETTNLARTSRELVPHVFEGVAGEPITGDEDYETLIFAAMKEDKIPFWLARKIESQLGYMSNRGRPPVGGNPQQWQAGQLYKALLRDLDTFYETAPGQEIQPELQRAKDMFRHGFALYNQSTARSFLSATKAPERAFAEAFTAGNVTATREVQAAVPPEVWDKAAQGWLAGLYEKHVRQIGNREDFNFGGFARDLQRYAVKTGGPTGETHLHVILGPEKAANLVDLISTFNQMRQPGSIVGRSSGTAERGLRYGQAASLPFLLWRILSGDPHAMMGLGVEAALGPGLGALTTRRGGIDAITRAFTPGAPLSPASRAALGQLGGQSTVPAVNYDAETLRRAFAR